MSGAGESGPIDATVAEVNRFISAAAEAMAANGVYNLQCQRSI